jgi:hypothetical protein
MSSRRVITLLVALMALASACAGPRRPLEVGVREFPTNVLFGSRETPPPPPPAANPNPGFPVLVPPPPIPPVTVGPSPRPAPSPQAACPQAHPFTAPQYIAGNRSESPPVATTYPFRNDGVFENVEGGQTTTGTFPLSSTRTIHDVEEDPEGSFTFSITEFLGSRANTIRYEVVPESPLSDQTGVFITQIITDTQSGGSEAFTPQPSLKLLQFPAENGAQWDSVGTDPLRQTTMRFHARIGREIPDGDDADDVPDLVPKIRVDACGTVIDAWYVDITDGQVIGPQTSLTFRSFYAVATQFGGFPVMEHIELSGNDRGVQTESRNTATISEEPVFPE